MTRKPLRARHLVAMAFAAVLALPQAGIAQAPAKPAPVAVSQQKVELLFVQNSSGIEYDKAKGTLRMKNIGRSTLFFTDRPVRMAGHYHTRDEFLPLWSEGPDSFAKSPPNATLSMLEVGKADLQNAVINLKNPRMHGKDLIYDITIIEGTVPQSAGDAVLFIDILGFWRRNIRRVAIIGTAAAVTTAAVTTSAAAASAAASQEAAAKAAAAKPAPQTTVTCRSRRSQQLRRRSRRARRSSSSSSRCKRKVSSPRPSIKGVAAGNQRNGEIGNRDLYGR